MERQSSSTFVITAPLSTEVEYLSESLDIQIGSNGIGSGVSTPPTQLSPERGSVSPYQFLADLFRPHVRDYESTNLVLDHLGVFCDTCLLVVDINHRANLGSTPEEMYRHSIARLLTTWPIDERVNADMRQALRTFDWHAFWNAIMGQAFAIRHYQNNPENYEIHRRSGSQRWIIMSAAYAEPANHAFAWDMMRYLEPIASRQASSRGFSYMIEVREVTGEDVHWFSRSFFRHWDQTVQLLDQRHPQPNPNDICYLLTTIIRLGMCVVDVFRKYWYQSPEDGSSEQFGYACARAGREFVDRQWRVQIDSPFGICEEAVPLPLHIRTVLAECDYIRARKTFFETVSYLVDTTEQEDLHGELIRLIVGSMKDWAAATGNEEMVKNAMEAFFDEENSQQPSSASYVAHNSWRDRPLRCPPLILTYDLPDDLPEAIDRSSLDSLEDDESNEEVGIQPPHVGRFRRFIYWLIPSRNGHPDSTLNFDDVELEAYGPRIDLQIVSHPCEPPQSDSCPICLEEFVKIEPSQETNTTTGVDKANKKSRTFVWRPKDIRKRRQAIKYSKTLQPMQFNLCNHIFHLKCMEQFMNQPYPTSHVVVCPCCRASICPSREVRAARRGFRRIAFIGRT